MSGETMDRERTGVKGTDRRLGVREMTATDLSDVLAIERTSFSTPWTEATFRGLLHRRDTELVVAEVEGRLVGYAVFWAVLDQGELGDLAVDPAWRRRRVGSTLVEEIARRAADRGVRHLYLEVRVSNEAAMRLYERHGFEAVGRRRGYYSAPEEDALVLRRTL